MLIWMSLILLVCWFLGGALWIEFSRGEAKDNPFRAALLFNRATFTIGSQTGSGAGATRNVAVQLKNANAEALQGRAICDVYLSGVSTGATISAVAPTSLLIGTNGAILASLVTSLMLKVCSNASGQFDLTITASEAEDYYMVVVSPEGEIIASTIIAMT